MAPPAMSAWSRCPCHGVIARQLAEPFTQNAVWDSQTVKKDLLENNVYRLIGNAPEEKLSRPSPTQHQTIGQ